MKKLALLLAVGSLWLFLAAVPAFADGGPHTASKNSGVDTLTADSCAGCHRAHTATGPYLINQPDEELLCTSCHGAGTGATTDVLTGVQYALATTGAPRSSTQLGALRGGGFEQARVGDPYKYYVGTSRLTKVQAKTDGTNTTSAATTSAHMDLLGTLGQPGKAWGQGANGSGVGSAVPAPGLGCTTCHNPHGNGKYRILNPVPVTAAFNASVAQVFNYTAASGVYQTVASHGFLVGDTVVVAGGTVPAATAIVATVPNDYRFTLTGITGGTDGTGGTATLSGGVTVTDAAAAPDGDMRNYTIIQTRGGTGSLLASQVAPLANDAGDYFHFKVPWNGTGGTTDPGYSYDAPNGIPGGMTYSSGRWNGTTGERSFSQELTAWCSSCHTRYYARSEPTDAAGGTGPAYSTARPGATGVGSVDAAYTYQHRTNSASARSCTTCHVSHGTNVVMDGFYSDTFTYPGGAAASAGNSRLLKVDNRGTCQLCHDPTGTDGAANNPVGPVPSAP